jgi:hypothetical protein
VGAFRIEALLGENAFGRDPRRGRREASLAALRALRIGRRFLSTGSAFLDGECHLFEMRKTFAEALAALTPE